MLFHSLTMHRPLVPRLEAGTTVPSPPPVPPGPARPSASTSTGSPSLLPPSPPPPLVASPAEERDAVLLSISATEVAPGVAVGIGLPCPSWCWSPEPHAFALAASCPWRRKSARTAASGCKKSPCASTTRASTIAGTIARLELLLRTFFCICSKVKGGRGAKGVCGGSGYV